MTDAVSMRASVTRQQAGRKQPPDLPGSMKVLGALAVSTEE